MRTSMIRRRNGFTLVELLVAIAIIGLLVAIAVPTAYAAYKRSKVAALKMEVTNIQMAIEQYKQKYGDYPPDGSNTDLVTRHLRKAFPRIAMTEFKALNDASGTALTGFPVMDAAESLVFFLGGFSDDPQKPLTGPGGPLTVIDASGATWVVQYNSERSNAIYDFDPKRLTIDQSTGATLSTDEVIFGGGSGGDALPAYLGKGLRSPVVYFDSRTYGFQTPAGYVFNKYYGGALNGVARPYKSNMVNTNVPATAATPAEFDRRVKYVNDKTFQIVCAGLDDAFGGVLAPVNSVDVLFEYPSGNAIHPDAGVVSQYNRYDEKQLDNITNYSEATLEDGLPN